MLGTGAMLRQKHSQIPDPQVSLEPRGLSLGEAEPRMIFPLVSITQMFGTRRANIWMTE